MGQSKKASLVEVVSGTLVAMGTALLTQLIIFPWFGIDTSIGENILITLIFTAVSVVRSYFWRRFMNMLYEKGTLV